MSDKDAITYGLRRCWVRKDNLRASAAARFDAPCWAAIVLEWVEVAPASRRQGVFSRFLTALTSTAGVDLFVVEAVQNPVLAAALERWGWAFDHTVMDFYLFADAAGRGGGGRA